MYPPWVEGEGWGFNLNTPTSPSKNSQLELQFDQSLVNFYYLPLFIGISVPGIVIDVVGAAHI